MVKKEKKSFTWGNRIYHNQLHLLSGENISTIEITNTSGEKRIIQ